MKGEGHIWPARIGGYPALMAAPNLQFSSESLGHLLADRWLEIPTYQRAYAWDEGHVAEFWSDIYDSRKDDRQYFLGAVVLTRHGSRYHVIDGQQRLATTTLLLAAIRDALLELGEDELSAHVSSRYLTTYNPDARALEPRLQVLAADRAFYEGRFILRAGGEPGSASQRRLTQAFNYLRAQVAELAFDANQLMDFIGHLEDSVLVVLVEAASEADAFQIFETLNDRGAPLTIADLLKNYLMSLAPDAVGEISEDWDYATANFGADEESDFVTFLRHYWSSVRGATRERDLYRSLRSAIQESSAATEFTFELASTSDQYAALLDPTHPLWSDYPAAAGQSVKTLLFLQLGQYRPLLLAAMREFSSEEFARLAQAVVCWNVRGLIAGGIGGGTTERAYASAGVNVRAGKLTSTEHVFNQLRPVVASDEEFRKAFEVAVLPRVRIAQYVLRSLDRALSDERDAVLEGGQPATTIVPLLHRAADQQWAAFAPEEVSRLTNRIGNLFLRPAGRQTLPLGHDERIAALKAYQYPVNAALLDLDYWNSTRIRHRQQDLAAVAVRTWPRSGPV